MRFLLAIAICLLLAAPAHAGWKMDRAEQVANVVWGNPCPWRIVWAQPPANHPEAAGWAMQDGCMPGGLPDVYLDANEPIHTFDVLCTRVLHERGHVVGASHSDNPRSVMFALDQTVEWRVPSAHQWKGSGDPRCRDRGRPFLEAHGVVPTSGDTSMRGSRIH